MNGIRLVTVASIMLFAACERSSKTGAAAKVPPAFPDSTTAPRVTSVIKAKPSDQHAGVTNQDCWISGDFDGDGTTEKLSAQTLSRPGYLEIHPYEEAIRDNYDKLVEWTVKRNPLVVLISDNPRLDTLKIGNGQIFGTAWLKNEGDLNGDGTDEFSYVCDYADWSNLNSCKIVGWQKGKWQELASFAIHESQLPTVPNSFPGFVTLVKQGTVRVKYYEPEAETGEIASTKIIRLRSQ